MQKASSRIAVFDGLMVAACLLYTMIIVVTSRAFLPFMGFALVPFLAAVSLLRRARQIVLGMQVLLGLVGLLASLWWCGMAGMVTNGAAGPDAQRLVREIQLGGLIVLLPITALHFLFARHLHFWEEE